MIFLKSLDYEEQFYDLQTDSTQYWKLQGLRFFPFTIIAGLNSTGKTRTCNVIRNTMNKIKEPTGRLHLGNTDLTVDIRRPIL
jgi:hypothetical protein